MCSGMTPPVVHVKELRWNLWLSGLAPWELHYLTGSFRELDWHDDFFNGLVTLDELSVLLGKVHDTFSVKV